MRGLIVPEGEKFERFFALVQQEAAKQNAVFFLECGEGHDFYTDEMEGEDLRGWLIPNELADKFEEEWSSSAPGEEWMDYIKWAEWSGSENAPVVKIVSYG